jgi:hypothetical protein
MAKAPAKIPGEIEKKKDRKAVTGALATKIITAARDFVDCEVNPMLKGRMEHQAAANRLVAAVREADALD